MEDLLVARFQMAMSLGFHIIFACVGIAMPLLMVIAEGMWLKTGDNTYLTLAKRWSKGTAIMFAVGAVSGTVLSFELGLLWPTFMAYAGPIIGMPFSLEGLAFFIEAIFLGIYLYGWERVPRKIHWMSGIMVLLGGTFSGIFVVTANAWMNTPVGFSIVDGKVTDIDPIAAMLNPSSFTQALHMTLAAFMAVAFAVAGIHAYFLRREPQNQFHRKAFAIALCVGAIVSILQPISGDISAKRLAKYQPIKLAAMEGQWETVRGAPLRIGGIPDEDNEVTRYALEIPKALSFLANFDPNSEIMGLKDVPRENRPPVAIVHFAFQIMVACGIVMIVAGILGGWLAWRKKGIPTQEWYLKFITICSPLGFIAIEAGWTVTEVGRQPWIIYNIMKTKDAVTSMPNLIIPFIGFTILYLFLSVVVVILLRRQIFYE
ncbi:cytochrome ubiquinol oxidase subunit I [Candidatus Poribacteria bacterium]|nr:cytochrome ubiquinol oxidase subunit I [Candidatus Poribacteria bacterium]